MASGWDAGSMKGLGGVESVMLTMSMCGVCGMCGMCVVYGKLLTRQSVEAKSDGYI